MPSFDDAASAAPRRTPLRVIKGEGQKKTEALTNRDAVTRVLIETGVDLLLRHISPERCEDIQNRVDRILALFDKVDARRGLRTELEQELNELEAVMRDAREKRQARRSR